MKAIETTATIEDRNLLLLDSPVPHDCTGKVRLLILLPDAGEIDPERRHISDKPTVAGEVIHLQDEDEAPLDGEDSAISSTIQTELKGLFSK